MGVRAYSKQATATINCGHEGNENGWPALDDRDYFYSGTKARLRKIAASLAFAIERSWLAMHYSGTFVTFTAAGAELFA